MNGLRSITVGKRNLIWGSPSADPLRRVAGHHPRRMMEDRKQRIKSLVEAGTGVLDHYQQLSASGKLSEKDARNTALEALRHMRYEGGNYLFGFDPEGNYYLSPASRDFEGTNKIDLKDANGKYLIRELIRPAAAVQYDFPNRVASKSATPRCCAVESGDRHRHLHRRRRCRLPSRPDPAGLDFPGAAGAADCPGLGDLALDFGAAQPVARLQTRRLPGEGGRSRCPRPVGGGGAGNWRRAPMGRAPGEFPRRPQQHPDAVSPQSPISLHIAPTTSTRHLPAPPLPFTPPPPLHPPHHTNQPLSSPPSPLIRPQILGWMADGVTRRCRPKHDGPRAWRVSQRWDEKSRS